MPLTTLEEARHKRLPALQQELTRAHCRALPYDPELDFWRGEEESHTSWTLRREQLRDICAACPVRAACLEVALRGTIRRQNDYVLAGHTGSELTEMRRAEQSSLSTALKADAEAFDEEREYARSYLTLQAAASAPTSETSARLRNNVLVIKAAADFARRKARRRAATGWGTAA